MAESPTDKDPILKEIVHRILSAYKPDLIYLFGSRAKVEGLIDGDYDLLVVVPSSHLPRYKRNQEAFRLLCGVGASKDVIVFTRKEFESKKTVVCSLVATVVREGILLHAA